MKFNFHKTRIIKILLSFVLITATAFNAAELNVLAVTDDDVGGYNHYTGGFTSVNNINYTYTTGTSSSKRTYATYAANLWSNNVSSQVHLLKNTTMTNSGYLAPIVISIMEYTPVDTSLLGRMTPFKIYGPSQAVQATNSETWVKALCYVYNVSHFINNGIGEEVIVKRLKHTTSHEVGHSLSIGHTPSGYDGCAVMGNSCFTTITLKSFDTQQLIAKWGT